MILCILFRYLLSLYLWLSCISVYGDFEKQPQKNPISSVFKSIHYKVIACIQPVILYRIIDATQK